MLKIDKKPYLVGLSYGTAVATELVKIDSSILRVDFSSTW